MPRFREAFEPWGVEHERRLVERRRVDGAEKAQHWIMLLIVGCLASQAAAGAAFCLGIDLPDEGYLVSEAALVVRLAAAGLGFVTIAFGATAAVVTLWNRSVLTAGWIVAGLTPWLLLVVEAAVVLGWLVVR